MTLPPQPYVVVPRRLRRVTRWAALALLVVMGAVAVGLRTGIDAAYFGVGDQVAMFGLGVVMAGLTLLVGRPRAEADERGVRVRNIVTSYDVPWSQVLGIRFDDGAPWAVLDLPQDEEISLMAVQASDGRAATEALRALRRLHAAATGSAP